MILFRLQTLERVTGVWIIITNSVGPSNDRKVPNKPKEYEPNEFKVRDGGGFSHISTGYPSHVAVNEPVSAAH